MPAGSLLPVSIRNNKLYFLFGKENPLEDSSHGFSDFGGGKEAGESLFETALREGSEELTGFFGSERQLRSRIRQRGGTYPIRYMGERGEYRVHIFVSDYDEELVQHFNDNHRFLWERMDKNMLNESRLFEKIELKWVCETELKSFMPHYRVFYREIVKEIIKHLTQIRNFVKKNTKSNKTKRVRFSNPLTIGKKNTHTSPSTKRDMTRRLRRRGTR